MLLRGIFFIICVVVHHCPISYRSTKPARPSASNPTYVYGGIFPTIQLKTLNLARNLLRAEGAANLPPLTQYPKAHVVAYRYYVGLYYFWNEQYDVAEQHLMFAFQHCHRGARKNKSYVYCGLSVIH